MQKYILKQQFEGFSVSNSEGLHKGYDRFQSILSQLEIHGAGVSSEDANQKFLRSLPSVWSQVSLIMRTKTGVDSLSFDDLYYIIYESLRMLTAYGVSNPSSQNSQYEQTSSYSLLANQSSCPQLDHEDSEQLDEFDLEEMDLKWNQLGLTKLKSSATVVTRQGILLESAEPREIKIVRGEMVRTLEIKMGEDLTSHLEEEEDYALMACNSSGSDTEIISCSKECKESYAELKKLYDKQRAQLSDASIEILSYTQALKKVEVQLVAHHKVNFEAEKEKEDLKAKVEKWHNSSKNLGKLLNSQMLYYRQKEIGDAVPPTHNREFTCHPDPDIEIDYSQFTYGPKQTQTSESETQTSDFDICESDCSVETHESLPKPAVNEPKVVNQPKVWSDAPIIEENSSQREIRPVWNNVQRVNHKNQFVPTAVLTRTGKIPVSTARASGTNNVNTARHNFNSQAVLTNAARKISTVKPFMNRLVLLGEEGKLLLSPQQVIIGDQKDITGIKSPNTMDYPHITFQNKGIVDSGCSRHMTGNNAYLAEYQDFNGGPVAFGGSKGYITSKDKIKIGKLDFEDVCFVKELQHFNLFFMSQIYDKKNKVLFTDSECLVLSPEFKLPVVNVSPIPTSRINSIHPST
ncbi:hypothetical protein Tco_0904264 [Tanacetum coccineum]